MQQKIRDDFVHDQNIIFILFCIIRYYETAKTTL